MEWPGCLVSFIYQASLKQPGVRTCELMQQIMQHVFLI